MAQKDYQICVSVLEAKHLAWAHIDLMVCVEIGGKKKKYTKPCKSTDSPYFNESFVFDFHITFAELRDKIINLSLIQAKRWNTLRRSKKVLANARLDVATVWQQPAHQFYHKWAVLTDPHGMGGGPKGYLKCDVSVLGRGDTVKMPPKSADEDDVEKNLMFPGTAAMVRRRVRYLLQFYWADDLGKGGTKWKFKEAVDPYVQVSFAGLVGRTSVRKNSSTPVWNEQLTFYEMFPPLCQRIKLDVKDNSNNTVIATHFIDLNAISKAGRKEFLPTFGPTLVHLYGTSTRAREGEAQATPDGAAYKGKLVLGLRTEEVGAKGPPSKGVHLEGIPPVNESKYWKMEDFLLFATIFDVSMLDPKISDKPLCLEVSLGNSGNSLVGSSQQSDKEGVPNDNAEVISKDMLRSSNDPLKARTTDGTFFYLPFGADKPCLAVMSSRPDTTGRMYNSNRLAYLAHLLVRGLARCTPCRHLPFRQLFGEKLVLLNVKGNDVYMPNEVNEILHFLVNELSQYLDWEKRQNRGDKKKMKKTELDKERTKLCEDLADHVHKAVKSLKENHNKENAKTVFYQMQKILNKIDFLAEDPQNALPDVFVWLLSGRKRLAFARLASKELLYSASVEERGHNCGRRQTLLLKIPGVTNPNIWGVVAKADVYLWLGVYTKELAFLKCLPDGYEELNEKHSVVAVPVFVRYTVRHGSEFVGMAMLQPPVKLERDKYEPPEFPPKLEWFKLFNGSIKSGEILAAFELLETSKDRKVHGLPQDNTPATSIPDYIRPTMVSYRLEVYFWGVRGLKKINLIPVERPRITLICGQISINSTTIHSAKKHPNFDHPLETKNLSLPAEDAYLPPLTIKLTDWSTGHYRYIGTHIVPSVRQFLYPLVVEQSGFIKRQSIAFNRDETSTISAKKVYSAPGGSQLRELQRDDYHPLIDKPTALQRNKRLSIFSLGSQIHDFDNENADILGIEEEKKSAWNCCGNCCKKKYRRVKTEPREKDKCDWWTKYYESLSAEKKRPMIKIYGSELEDQPEFGGFHDPLQTFNLHRGKRTSDEQDEEKVIGSFKGALRLYRWPPPPDTTLRTQSGVDVRGGVFRDFPRNEAVAVVVRVYVIRATYLRPKDVTGKADPYIQVLLGSRLAVSDQDNYVPRQLEPIFGRCYELKASFPVDSILTVRVLDHDVLGKDDLIGETKLDLEDRYMSQHRATCGLASKYHESGYNTWRDTLKPTQILGELCSKHNLEGPTYFEDMVVIGDNQFQGLRPSSSSLSLEMKTKVDNANYWQEGLALVALHNWHQVPVFGCKLVPEHIERRSLYNPVTPGIEQGKLEMWVDLFPVADVLTMKPPVDVSRRMPEKYQLRIIVWNTEAVLLEESDVITGKKKSDIYIQGRLTGDDEQKTDVHYNSMTGEGNFNWRFVFPFDYLPSEKKLVTHKKESVFAREETEFKLPCRLVLQIWDNDVVSRDDFIGSLTLDLHSFPHGARSARRCKLNMLKTDGSVPTTDIFRQRRAKGWWPFSRHTDTKPYIVLAGKMEAEIELLTAEEAEKNPVGLGRKEPEPLDKPIRPETLRWFMKPLKSLRILLWRKCKKTCCKLIVIILIIAFVIFYLYAIPYIMAEKTFSSMTSFF